MTASALLDLVSETWLQTVARHCREAGAAVLFALTYNGRSHCSPEEPEDDAIRELMNRHQRANDKGFGPAAGPEAIECAARSFAAVGYHVRRESSDWVLPPYMRELQRQLIEGWAEAALEIAPGSGRHGRRLAGAADRACRGRPLARDVSATRTLPRGCRLHDPDDQAAYRYRPSV